MRSFKFVSRGPSAARSATSAGKAAAGKRASASLSMSPQRVSARASETPTGKAATLKVSRVALPVRRLMRWTLRRRFLDRADAGIEVGRDRCPVIGDVEEQEGDALSGRMTEQGDGDVAG